MTNYPKQMYKQLLEETAKAEKLAQENRELQQEVNRLERKIVMLEENLDAKIEAAIQKATKPLIEQNNQNEKIINAQRDEIVRLKAVINKDSSNSSKPPSSNGFKKVIANSREQSGKKTGGQKGHPGRSLCKPKNWDELIRNGTARVEDHTNGNRAYESRYVVDINISVQWTEHRYSRGSKELHGIPPIRYGERLQALALLLSEEEYVGQERVCEFIQILSGGQIHLSEGWLNKVIQRFSGRLEGELTKITEDLLNGTVIYTDETPMKTTEWMEPKKGSDTATLIKSQKTSEMSYIRVHSNEHTTLFTVNRHKDMEGVKRDGILTKSHGIISHDHDKKYYHYGNGHATCNGHLGRELKGISDHYQCTWAKEMRSFMNEMNAYKKVDQEGKTPPPYGCDPKQFEIFSERYDALLNRGILVNEKVTNKYGKNELRKILKRLRSYKDAYLLFLKNYEAPFTNNLAERDLRPCKNKQKISGCFRSWSGIVAFARIRSFTSTVRKRNLNMTDAIISVIRGIPVLG